MASQHVMTVREDGRRQVIDTEVACDEIGRRDDRPAASRRIVVIVNPATRGDAASTIALLRRHAPAGVDLDVHVTPGPGTTVALTRAAVAEGARMAVAVGGDGTVAAVATALCGTGLLLGIIPAGSTNVTARELGIPTDAAAAVALLFGPQRHARLDVGQCGDLCFLHMAGAGLDSRMFAAANPARKRQIGWLAYVPPALHALPHPLARFTIVTDGGSMEVTAPLVLVANGSSIITPRLWLYPGIRTDDGWLDVLAFTPHGPVQVARTLGRLAVHGLAGSRYVTRVRARRIELASDPPLPVELDGDVVTHTPVTLTIAPAALTVITPLQKPWNRQRVAVAP
jgi:diacylglycerol kinase family enzyme